MHYALTDNISTEQHQQRESGTALRQDQRVNGTKRVSGGKQSSGESGTAERRCNSPEQRGGSDIQITAKRVGARGHAGDGNLSSR